MNTRKMKNMLVAYDGFRGPQTMAHVSRLVGDIPGLTGKQLGMAMSAVNRAYHEGKASMGAEVDGDFVYINKLEKGFGFEVLKRLKKTETRVCNKVYYDGNLCDVMQRKYMTHDDMPRNEHKSVREMYYVSREDYCKWYCYESETVTTWELMPE